MKLIPTDTLEKLEFDKILLLLQPYAFGQAAKEQILRIQPTGDFQTIQRELNRTLEFKTSIEENDRVPLAQYQKIDEYIGLLKIENYVLETEQLLEIRNIVVVAGKLFNYFSQIRQKIYPALYSILSDHIYDNLPLVRINKVFDEEGGIKSDASDELVRIRKRIISRQAILEKQFKFALNTYRAKGFLADTQESIRNGRRVLCVLSEYKRQLRGIIHDESATGKTTFIEPEEIIEINNDIFDLEQEERREIYKILRDLCEYLSHHSDEFLYYQSLIIQFDIINTKACLALQYNGQKPNVLNKPYISFINALHPLLYLKNKEIEKPVIPFSLRFEHNNRILILSGPNAGGKSITMKSVGLLQVMLQSGILVSMDKTSEAGVFKNLFTDIGDQQSLEDDLSTYSSRIKNMKSFLENADKDTLVIIDEFGSGTDPKIGGAIAEAILRELHKKSVFAIITTHYSNLKVYAFKNKGIINASMHFDKEHLSPSYQLMVGKPGSSYAFEIAQKSGLPEEVLHYARNKSGKNEKAIDELLIDLQTELKDLQDKMANIKEREAFLDRLIKNYDQLQKELEIKRKQFKLEKKEKQLQQSYQESQALEKLMRELKDEKNVPKIKKLSFEIQDKKKQLEEEVVNLEVDIEQKYSSVVTKKSIEVGDFVRLKTGGATGKVIAIDKQKAIVEMGEMKLNIKVKDLLGANEPLPIQKYKSINTNLQNKDEAESKIDLRGMRKEEALHILEGFLDNALIHSLHSLKILHGKGDGILRKAVYYKLKEYKDVSKIYHPKDELGGNGVTLVEL